MPIPKVIGQRLRRSLHVRSRPGPVKNVLAAGGCELRARGQTIQLGSPRLFHDESRASIRPVERQVLRVLDVADFLTLAPASAGAAAPGC